MVQSTPSNITTHTQGASSSGEDIHGES